MRRELLIAVGPGEWRAALTEDGAPVELYVERGDRFALNGIHLGRAVRRVESLGAVLVEIGDERPGFLPLRDVIRPIGRLDEGGRVVVQIRREAQHGKAARLTTRLALRGRWLELAAGRTGGALDAALLAADRARLLAAVEDAEGARLALHDPAAALPTLEALLDEAAALSREWLALHERAASLEPPARLDPAPDFAAALASRLPYPPERVIADDIAVRGRLRAVFPAASVAIGELSLDLDAVFDAALADRVALPRGGLVRIEQAHTATVIDVDTETPATGSAPNAALAVNLAAARVIAQQIRLRNLAGGVVIDFVGLEGRGARDRVRAALADGLAGDPAVPQLLGWTRLGHFELVRPRRGRPIADILLDPAPGGPVKTAATVAFEGLRALTRAARQQPAANWRLAVSPTVAEALRGTAAGAVSALEARLGRTIAIAVGPERQRDRVELTPV
jgi:ribonuclease G